MSEGPSARSGDGDGPARASAAPKPAWYAASPGAWRDWVTVLHPPYTAWHLSYVLIGAAMAPHFHLERLGATLIAFGLAVGIGAHGLDELRGRPLNTAIPSAVLASVSVAAICGAIVIGAVGIEQVGWGLAVFILLVSSWSWLTTWSCGTADFTTTQPLPWRGARSRC